jgi:hypothetical protein
LAFALAFWHALLARTTDCNSRVYHRYQRPVRYWLTLRVWFIGYAFATANQVLALPDL